LPLLVRKLGRHQLLTRLASGGLGDVYLSQVEPKTSGLIAGSVGIADVPRAELEPMSRWAIKLIRPELAADPRVSNLILTEAETAIGFSHRAAATVVEAAREGDDLFLRSELIGGQTLATLLKKLKLDNRPLDHSLACHVGAELASALGRAHQLTWHKTAPSRFVLATLSPRRVMITYDGRVKVIGLGTARARLLVPLQVGTIAYAAPEILADKEPLPRSDIYSLGLVLYYAFTGKELYRRADEEKTRAAVKEANAPALTSRILTVDPTIGDLVAEMIAWRVDARPESMDPLVPKLRSAAKRDPADLEDLLAGVMKGAFPEEIDGFRRMTIAQRGPSVVPRSATLPPKRPTDPLAPRPVERLAPARVESFVEAPKDAAFRAERAPRAERLKAGEPALPIRDPPDMEAPKAPWTGDMEPLEDVETVADTPLEAPSAEKITEPDRPSPLGAGARRRVARYVVERVVGQSGSRAIYVCRDPNVARRVTVKVMDPEAITDPRLVRSEWVRLFKLEARLLGRVRHESFPALHDAGRDDGAYFMTFELLPGDSLSVRLDRGERFDGPKIRRIFEDLARGLEHLHELGYVSGDVRASNVLVTPDGRGRLVDFSMASEIAGPQHPLLTSNIFCASPEHVAGEPYSPKGDQFALGMLLYQVLVGARPFRGLDDAELARAIQTAEPRVPEAIAPDIDPVLSQVAMRLLEKDPSARFDSMGELVSALGAQGDATRPDVPAGEGYPRPPPPSPVASVLEHDTDPMIARAALAPAFEIAGLADVIVGICERVTTLATQDFGHRATSEGPAMARSIARRLGLGPAAEMQAAVAVAIRDLAERMRVSIESDEMAHLVPRELVPICRAVDGGGSDTHAVAGIIAVVEGYVRATRPWDGGQRISPRRAILTLKDRKDLPAPAIEALIEHLREVISALDLTPQAPDAPRILVAGIEESAALLHALEFDGYAIEEAKDGHAAWEKLRRDSYRGAIVDAALPGRDGLSLLKLCRAHPDTARVAFLILGDGDLSQQLEDAGGATLVERSAAVERIREHVGRLLHAPARAIE
jgi:serine/threonine protein kinase/CheY-like chemotaxis protein